MSPIINPLAGGGGGSAQPIVIHSSLTANRASGFGATHVYDLGGPCLVYTRLTATTLIPDGETWGFDPGGIAVGTGLVGQQGDVGSLDNVSFASGPVVDNSTSRGFSANSDFIVVGDYRDSVNLVPRYFRKSFSIDDSNSGNVYAGANNPVAVCAVLISYTVLAALS